MESARIRDSKAGGPSVRVGGNLLLNGGRPRREGQKSRSNKISSIILSCISLSAPSALRLASSNKSIMIGNHGCGLMYVCLAWRSTLVKLSTTILSPFTSWIIMAPSSCRRPSFNPPRTVFSWNETWNTFARKDSFQSMLPTRVKFTRLCTNFLCLVQSIVTLQSVRLIFASTQASNRLSATAPCGSDAQGSVAPGMIAVGAIAYSLASQPRNDWFGAQREECQLAAAAVRRDRCLPPLPRPGRVDVGRTRTVHQIPVQVDSQRCFPEAAKRSPRSSRCDTPAKSGCPDFSISDGVRRGMPIAQSDLTPVWLASSSALLGPESQTKRAVGRDIYDRNNAT